MSDNIDQVMQRTHSYWYEDGLAETGTGLLLGILGLYFWAQEAVSLPPSISWIMPILFPVILIGGLVVGKVLIRAAKERITYPRTGYVAYRQPSQARRLVSTAAAAVIAAIVMLVFITTRAPGSWIPLMDAVAMGGLLFYMGYQVNLTRFYLLAGLSVLFGVGLFFTPLGENVGMAILFGVLGLATLFSGLLTLFAYLREAPAREEDD